MSYILILSSIFLGAFAQVLMKIGTSKIQLNVISIITSWYIMSGLSLYAFSAVFWIFAISKVQLSLAYPMVSLGYIIVFILSYFILGESISLLRLFGLFTIIAGVIIVAKS
ncbi:MAG: transporter [Desulfosporosinus sp.]|nr:transporter [Desulfosporosinus sp.]